MKNKFYTQAELLQKTEIKLTDLQKWINLKLIRPTGITPDQESIFAGHTIEQIDKIRGLQQLGYDTEEIQKIVRKIGLPQKAELKSKNKSDQFLTVGDLADKISTSARTIKHWETIGIIEADMRTEGGFRLYSDHWIFLCQLIKDLQLFGYSLDSIKKISDHFREYLAFHNDINVHPKTEIEAKTTEWNTEIEALFIKMDEYKQAIQRWDDLLKKKKREINAIKTSNQKRPTAKGDTNA